MVKGKIEFQFQIHSTQTHIYTHTHTKMWSDEWMEKSFFILRKEKKSLNG